MDFMKRLFSWLVLYIEYCIVVLLVHLLLFLVGEFFNFTDNFNLIIRLIIYAIFGSTILGLLFVPFMYFPILIISGSNAICPSRTGKRYRVFFAIMLAHNFLSMVSYLSHGEFFSMITSIILCIFSIVTIATSRTEI